MILCIVGFIGYAVAFAILWFFDSPEVAAPFGTVGMFLSLPLSMLGAYLWWGYPHLALFPVLLVLNSFLVALLVWTFLKLKAIADKKVYGVDRNQ